MSKNFSVSYEERVRAIEKYLRHEASLNHLAKQLKVSHGAIKQWLITYQSLGPAGLMETSRNMRYSSSMKEAAVMDYLAGAGSYIELCKKYGIKSTRQLRNWVSKYNGHEKLKSSGTGGVPIMTKGRKTSYEERVEIVKYCIEQQNDYAKTAQKYRVSYQQVYSWTTKYETNGVEALQDKRGKRKTLDKMSEIEQLKAENKLLEAKNKRQQMEIDFLKKLEEIERRRF
ncbi:helix-turn-helix domain-containing protein [Sporomusa malonica]|uniref:Transposase and inactivated derivatives n=1 Tax=Sporomusa malonica TaxID=112901 RepID=A0A1W2DEL4_9FIRM|nr:helix-turn-helix domain-containing protein [Sporomusa malonica]SMC95496.1 Transposase and inactivated derivatives [Sporomusa malonica]